MQLIENFDPETTMKIVKRSIVRVSIRNIRKLLCNLNNLDTDYTILG